jgi:hypothetical protein
MGNQLTGEQIQWICQRVYRQYPAVAGVRPSLQSPKSGPTDRVLLVFKGSAQLADGARLPVTVRVTADLDGRIVKMTSSR